MPRSFQKRRGKPRLELQQENVRLPQKSQQPTESRLTKIKPDNTTNESKDDGMDEKELQDKMWTHASVSKDNPIAAPLHRSQFAVRFPQSRETYIRTVFAKMRRHLKKYGIHIEANYSDCVLTVSTTDRTWDPYCIIKARDMMRLIARYVPFEEGSKVLSDNVFSDIIEIGKTQVARNQVRFIKRRSRLIGPNGVTLRAIELLTKCYILVYGRTVCVIGPMNGISTVRRIVLDCMKNIHPIYALKRLMVLKELKNNDELKTQRWNRFLPTFKKIRRNGNNMFNKRGAASKTLYEIKKNMRRKRNRRYTPYPPAPTPSKIDIAMESGEYWNKTWQKENLKRVSKEEKYKEYLQQKDVNYRIKQIRDKKEAKIVKQMKKFQVREAPTEIDSRMINKRLNLQNKIGKLRNDKQNSMENKNELLQNNVLKIQRNNTNYDNTANVKQFFLD